MAEVGKYPTRVETFICIILSSPQRYKWTCGILLTTKLSLINEQDLPDVIWLVSDGVKMGIQALASELFVVFHTNIYILILLPWNNNAAVSKQSPVLKEPH